MTRVKRAAWPPGSPRRRTGLTGLSGLGWAVLLVVVGVVVVGWMVVRLAVGH